jgi:hypothetical protein
LIRFKNPTETGEWLEHLRNILSEATYGKT